eukprot:364076-Chlamydomonas_euryale.AAC.5
MACAAAAADCARQALPPAPPALRAPARPARAGTPPAAPLPRAAESAAPTAGAAAAPWPRVEAGAGVVQMRRERGHGRGGGGPRAAAGHAKRPGCRGGLRVGVAGECQHHGTAAAARH